MLGPILGQVLHTLVGYEATFYIFAGILSVNLILVIVLIPKRTNYAEDAMSKSEIESYFERMRSSVDIGTSSLARNQIAFRSGTLGRSTPISQISYLIFLKNKRAFMAAMSTMLAMICMLFFDSILAV